MKRLSALSILMVLTTTACQPASGQTIKIGFIGPLTGDAAGLGVDILNGARMAVDEINAAGGIGGKQVELIAEDGKCSGGDAATAAQKLVNVDRVVAILGGQCSGETLAAAPIAEAGKIILLSSVSSSPDVTKAGDFVFRDYPSDALKTKAMAKYFAEKEFTKLAVITENNDFAQGFRASLKEDAEEDMMVFDELVEPGTKDFRTLMTRLKAEDFDVFFPNGGQNAVVGEMVKQYHEAGLGAQVIGSDVLDTLDALELAGDGADGVHAINIATIGDDTTFATEFTEKYGAPQAGVTYAAYSYDAAKVLMQAFGEVGIGGEAVRDYFYNLPSYTGIVGSFSFDANGDVEGIPYVLKEHKDGTMQKIADISVQ